MVIYVLFNFFKLYTACLLHNTVNMCKLAIKLINLACVVIFLFFKNICTLANVNLN